KHVTEIESAFELLFKRALGQGVHAAICLNFLLSCVESDVYGGWAPRTFAALDQDLRHAIFVVLEEIAANRWRPSDAHARMLVERDSGVALGAWSSVTR